jgi:hypothetical protein
MPTSRKRIKKGHVGAESAWVQEYLKTGKEPKEGEPGHDEWCSYSLLNINVRGLPEKNSRGFWFADHKGT